MIPLRAARAHHVQRPHNVSATILLLLVQTCHLPAEPLELLPHDFALGVLPLDSLP